MSANQKCDLSPHLDETRRDLHGSVPVNGDEFLELGQGLFVHVRLGAGGSPGGEREKD